MTNRRNAGSKAPQRSPQKIARYPSLRWLLFGLLSIVASASGATLALGLNSTPFYSPWSAHLPTHADDLDALIPATLGRSINVLVLGIDNSADPSGEISADHTLLAGNSDTMLLVRIEPDTHQVNVLSIPRDTLVQLPDVGTDKINDANVRGGASLAAQTVSQLLNGVPIDRYLRVSTSGLVHLVDAIGGVEVNIPKPMDYSDRTQHLQIHFAPGRQTLNGQHLQEYVRFRHDEWGDIGRVQRQQEVLKALLHQLLQPATMQKVPQLLQVAQTNIDSDLSLGEMVAIFRVLMSSDSHHLHLVMLPGRFSEPTEYPLSYWMSDSQATAPILARYFNAAIAPATPNPTEIAANPNQIRIAIANGTQNPNAGNTAVAYLQQHGFSQAYLSDHEIDSEPDSNLQTQIIAQHGNPDMAELVKKTIAIGQIQVSSTGDLNSDVTIVLRDDWATQLKR